MAFISVTETGDVSTQTWTDYSQKENTTEEIVTGGDDEGDEIIEQVLSQWVTGKWSFVIYFKGTEAVKAIRSLLIQTPLFGLTLSFWVHTAHQWVAVINHCFVCQPQIKAAEEEGLKEGGSTAEHNIAATNREAQTACSFLHFTIEHWRVCSSDSDYSDHQHGYGTTDAIDQSARPQYLWKRSHSPMAGNSKLSHW